MFEQESLLHPIKLPTELKEALKVKARENYTSLNSIVRQALADYLDRNPVKRTQPRDEVA